MYGKIIISFGNIEKLNGSQTKGQLIYNERLSDRDNISQIIRNFMECYKIDPTIY